MSGSVASTPDRPAEIHRSRRSYRERLRAIHPAAWLQLLALVPALIMLDLVQDSSQLHWFDYWRGLAIYTDADGSLRPFDLLYFHEGHVLAFPSLVFWINVQLTDGLSQPIGYYVIAVVLIQLLVLRFLLPSPQRLGPWWHSLLVVAFAVLLFAPQGAWNFSRSMSGAAWLTANMFTLVAIAFTSRGRLFWAILFAGLASLSYGTGLMAWPAIAAVALLRGGWGWRGWALVGAATVTFSTYAITYQQPASQTSPGFDLNDIARRFFQVVGSVLSPDPEIALILGVLVVGIAGVLVVACLRSAEVRPDAVPWTGVAIYAVLAGLMIGVARGGVNDENIGVASRYASLSILLCIALLALAVIRYRPDARVALVCFGIAALAFASGQPTLASLRGAGLNQDELAIAIRMDVSNGYPYTPSQENVPLIRSLGHYPFSLAFDDDCGLLGERIPADSIVPPSAGSRGNLDRFEPSYNPDSVRLTGWYGSDQADVRCVVFTDDTRQVIGAAATGYERADVFRGGSPNGRADLGFTGPALAGAEEYRAYAFLEGMDGAHEVTGALGSDPPP